MYGDPRESKWAVYKKFGKYMGTLGGHSGSFISGLGSVWGSQIGHIGLNLNTYYRISL